MQSQWASPSSANTVKLAASRLGFQLQKRDKIILLPCHVFLFILSSESLVVFALWIPSQHSFCHCCPLSQALLSMVCMFCYKNCRTTCNLDNSEFHIFGFTIWPRLFIHLRRSLVILFDYDAHLYRRVCHWTNKKPPIRCYVGLSVRAPTVLFHLTITRYVLFCRHISRYPSH